MEKPDKKDFTLVKVKYNKEVLSVDFELVVKMDDQINIDKITRESSITPHPDLLNCFKELKTFLADCWGFNAIDIISSSNKLSDMQKTSFTHLKNIFIKLKEEMLESIDVSGISISGEDEKKGLVITGKKKASNGKIMAMNSPLIILSQTSFGFEPAIEEIYDKINSEVYEFLFNGKEAQLKLDLKNK
jgi:hypothetical protein